jgi:hypothetical protein
MSKDDYSLVYDVDPGTGCTAGTGRSRTRPSQGHIPRAGRAACPPELPRPSGTRWPIQVLTTVRVRRARERDDDHDEDHLAGVGIRILRRFRPARQPLLAAGRCRCCRDRHGHRVAAPEGGALMGTLYRFKTRRRCLSCDLVCPTDLGKVAESALEEVEGTSGAFPRRRGVAGPAFEVDPEDAHQRRRGDKRLHRVGSGASLFGQQRGQGLLEPGEHLPLAGAQRGAVADQAAEPGRGLRRPPRRTSIPTWSRVPVDRFQPADPGGALACGNMRKVRPKLHRFGG